MRAAQAASSSGVKTLSRLSIRSRCSAAVKSVAKPAPPTSWVGESGVRSSGCSSSSAVQLAQQLVELGVGDDRRVPDVVAELVLAHLVGEFLPAAAQVGVWGFVGLLRQRRLRLGVAFELTLAG